MKRIFSLLLALAVLMGLLAGCTQSGEGFRPAYYSNEASDAAYTLENDTLRFTLDGKTSCFTLTDKRSGRVWTSVPEGGGGGRDGLRHHKKRPALHADSDLQRPQGQRHAL